MFTNIKDCVTFIETSQRKSTKSLEHMRQLVQAYGNPQLGLKFIHVAGTNGKGSIVSYLKEIFYDANYSVGTFTSPYIECFNERISYNKKNIPDELIIKYTNLIISKYDYLEEHGIEHPSFFEILTLMCFMYFKDMNTDIAIIETGIGGLLDSTNIITPLLSIISNVSYDHMSILGDTLEEIAINKLGIVKENIPLVTISNPKLNDLFTETCAKLNSKLVLVNKEDIKNVDIKIGATKFDYLNYKNINIKMSGLYQTENASIAIEAANLLKEYYSLSDENILNGLKNTFWLGRLEVVQENPYIILDGAHNIDGIQRLHEFIKTIKKDFNKIILVLAISSNKETRKMINEIESDVDRIIFTSFTYKRSEDYLILYNYSNHPNKEYNNDILSIISQSKNNKDNNTIWIFSGSLYFVSELRKKFI